MPPWAISKRPLRSARASVKAPRTWPNISLSKSVDEMPPRFTLTNGPDAAPAVAVDGFGDELLAGAALAGDEHRRVGHGHAADELEDPEQSRVAADHLAEVVARIQLLAGERRAFAGAVARRGEAERGRHALEELLVGPRLGDEVGRAGLHALHGERDRTPRRQQDDGHLGPRRLEAREQFEPFSAGGLAREVHVLDDEREVRPPGRRERLAGRGGRNGGVAVLLQQQRQRRGHRRIVIDEQDHSDRLQEVRSQKQKTVGENGCRRAGLQHVARCGPARGTRSQLPADRSLRATCHRPVRSPPNPQSRVPKSQFPVYSYRSASAGTMLLARRLGAHAQAAVRP